MEWQEYLERSKNNNVLKIDLNKYATRIANNGFTVIFDYYHLCYLLQISPSALNKIISATSNFYRQFTIPKKVHGLRTINVPYPSLGMCQTWIKDNILDKIPTHDCCYSYVIGKSIVNNATVHIGTKVLYKLDIQDFFDSIKINRLISIFVNCGYSYKVSYYLGRICTFNDSLPQGACTSPQLSNIVCKRLDRRLAGIAEKEGLIYSRYADDICFSGDFVSINSQRFIKSVITSEGFGINNRKEKLITGKKKIVTGISVGDTSVRIQRKYKRDLKSKVYKFLTYEEGLSIDSKSFDPLFKEKLIGKLNFWRQVEGNAEYINELIAKIQLKETTYISSIQ